MKVTNFKNKNGKAIANQFRISSGSTLIFQSYDSIIVRIIKGKTFLDKNNWNYSPTTIKYRNIFLGETTAETKRKIDDGTYILTDLN